MSDYDRWLEAPAVDIPEPDICDACDGEGEIADPDGVFDVIVCPACGGSCVQDPPTREEIRERRDEDRFDALHEEGRI